MITHKGFWKGRDIQYKSALTAEIERNASNTIGRVNMLLVRFYAANPTASIRDANSGWRPPAVNERTEGAAIKSHHLAGRACDIDDDDGLLDKWLMTPEGQKALVECGLWMEHPSATPRWCHVQTMPPGSKRRVFYP